VRSLSVIVAVNLAVEDYGGRARSEGFARHLEFVRIGRLKAGRCKDWDRNKISRGQDQGHGTATSGKYSTK